MENINDTNDLIKECTSDIIMSICFLGNTFFALSIFNNYYIDKDYNNLYNSMNLIIIFSLVFPYYILYTKYIKYIKFTKTKKNEIYFY
jgi:hypothetical protein